jgi:hypothetical protein
VLPVAAALFLALTDAFDLAALSLWARLIYWLVLLGIGQAVAYAIRGMIDRLRPSPAHTLLVGLAISVLVSLPMTAMVWLVTSWILSEPLDAARLPGFYLPVLVITAAMAAINLLIHRRPLETHAGIAAGGAEVQRAPIVARLPPRLRSADIQAIEAEDHYVRVHTTAGSDLVLMRFADALDELRGIEGAQVHRSWWVARGAVNGSCREHGRIYLVLGAGAKAPVSRSYARALRQDGWL